VVLKKLTWVFQKSLEVVEKNDRVVCQMLAEVVENELARYVAPSWPSKVPLQFPVASKVRTPPVWRRPVPVRSVKVSLPTPRLVVVAFVVRRFEAKRLVEVALVVVAKTESILEMVDEPAMSPLVKERIVVVAFPGNGSCRVDVASVPHERTPVAEAFTSQLAALRFDTVSAEEEAPLPKVWSAVKTLVPYVFGIVVEASAK